MAEGMIEMRISLTPTPETMSLVLALLNMWQDANPDLMVAMVPDRDKYCYEIIRKGA